jgi:hypothetical protein
VRRTVLPIAAILLTAACGTSTPQSTPATNVTANDPRAKAPAPNLDAAAVFKSLAAAVPTAKLTETLTAANDPNHLLGRPNQYTSKIGFADSQIPDGYTQFGSTHMFKTGDVQLGGSVEVFTNPDDAAARAKLRVPIITSSQVRRRARTHGGRRRVDHVGGRRGGPVGRGLAGVPRSVTTALTALLRRLVSAGGG